MEKINKVNKVLFLLDGKDPSLQFGILMTNTLVWLSFDPMTSSGLRIDYILIILPTAY
jgi:hypothetical protein